MPKALGERGEKANGPLYSEDNPVYLTRNLAVSQRASIVKRIALPLSLALSLTLALALHWILAPLALSLALALPLALTLSLAGVLIAGPSIRDIRDLLRG
jgi:hypothetical protein